MQSEEDKKIKEQIELIVERVQDSDPGVQKVALETMREELKATGSVTSIPKPLKFLRPHYETLSKFYKTMKPSENKVSMDEVNCCLFLSEIICRYYVSLSNGISQRRNT